MCGGIGKRGQNDCTVHSVPSLLARTSPHGSVQSSIFQSCVLVTWDNADQHLLLVFIVQNLLISPCIPVRENLGVKLLDLRNTTSSSFLSNNQVACSENSTVLSSQGKNCSCFLQYLPVIHSPYKKSTLSPMI